MTAEAVGEGPLDPSAVAQLRGDEDRIVDDLARITADWTRQVEEIAVVLRLTPSRKVRDAAAIALVDMNARNACDSVIAVLRRPEIGREAGTLLYALDELGASIPLDVAVSLIKHGSYEARAETILLMQEGRIGSFDAASRLAASSKLVDLQTAPDEELAKAATLALDAIDRCGGD